FDASITCRKLLLNLLEHMLLIVHPDEAIYRDTQSVFYKVSFEINSLASVGHIEQCHFKTELESRQLYFLCRQNFLSSFPLIQILFNFLTISVNQFGKIIAIVYAETS